LSDDGDPLDVLVLVDAPSFTGCVMTVRPIGALRMTDQGSEDEKILGVGLNNPIYKNLNDYSELYPHTLLEIEHFFSVYKELESKRTRIKGWEDAEAARRIVTESQERYVRKR
jgi:inorganic pyrophosphatase